MGHFAFVTGTSESGGIGEKIGNDFLSRPDIRAAEASVAPHDPGGGVDTADVVEERGRDIPCREDPHGFAKPFRVHAPRTRDKRHLAGFLHFFPWAVFVENADGPFRQGGKGASVVRGLCKGVSERLDHDILQGPPKGPHSFSSPRRGLRRRRDSPRRACRPHRDPGRWRAAWRASRSPGPGCPAAGRGAGRRPA